MTVRQIALSAAVLLQADDIEELLVSDTPDGTESDDVVESVDGNDVVESVDGSDAAVTADPTEDADVKTLIKCINLAAAELCANGFPVCVEDVATAHSGVIAIDALTDVPSTVRDVRKNGRHVNFSWDSRGIFVPADGEYSVIYTVSPIDKRLDEQLVIGAGADENTVTYLAARNYCLITGRTDEAQIWDQRYCAEAENKRMTRRATLRRRTWR